MKKKIMQVIMLSKRNPIDIVIRFLF